MLVDGQQNAEHMDSEYSGTEDFVLMPEASAGKTGEKKKSSRCRQLKEELMSAQIECIREQHWVGLVQSACSTTLNLAHLCIRWLSRCTTRSAP